MKKDYNGLNERYCLQILETSVIQENVMQHRYSTIHLFNIIVSIKLYYISTN